MIPNILTVEPGGSRENKAEGRGMIAFKHEE